MGAVARNFIGLTLAWLLLATSSGQAAPVLSDPDRVEALQSMPQGSADVGLREAVTLLSAGQPARSEARARELIAAQPRSAPAHEVLGAALALQGKLDEAVTALQLAVELNPRQATAYTKLGDIALARGQVSQAVQHFERAVAADPTERLAHQRLGLHYESLGETTMAIRHFEAGVAGTPADYLGVKLNLARLYILAARFNDAVELLRPWSADLDARADVHRVLGVAHFSTGELPSAVRHLKAAVKLDPADGTSFSLLADAVRRASDPELGITVYQELVDAGDASVGVYGELGLLLQSERRFERAEQVYREMVQLFPDQAEGYFLLGAFYGFLMRYDDAADVYRRGLELAAYHAGLLRGAAATELRRGNPEAALELALRLAEVAADTAADAFHRGLAYEQLGRAAEAERSYREALALQAEHWPSLNNLAVILVSSGRSSEALMHAERAAGLAGQNPSVLHTLGWAQLEQDRIGEAVATLERAIALRPDAATFNYHLGRAYLARGDADRGRELVRRALELDADFSHAGDARELLAR